MIRIATVICAHEEARHVVEGAEANALPLGPVCILGGAIGEAFKTQAEMRQAGLEWAREEGADWLLQLAADERISGVRYIPGSLEGWREPWFPTPYIEEGGWPRLMGHKFLNLHRVRRIVAWGSFVELDSGEVWECGAIDGGPYLKTMHGLPWRIEHHPELRPDHSTRVRLGALEPSEPVPARYRVWRLPVLSSRKPVGGTMSETETEPTILSPGDEGYVAADPDTHYCPGCGARYTEAGVCEMEHPPIAVVPLDQEDAPAPSTAPEVDPEVQPFTGDAAEAASQVPDLMRQVAEVTRDRDEWKAKAEQLERDVAAVAADRDEWRDKAQLAPTPGPEDAPEATEVVTPEGGATAEGEPEPAPAPLTTPEQ